MFRFKKYPFIVFLNPKTGMFDELLKICSDIAEKDPTFIYLPQERKDRIILFVEDQDSGHKKGMWIFHKTGTIRYYAVRPNKKYAPELPGQSE